MNETPWWQHGIIYQIYPRSYQDSTGNGIGDLQGIISRLDYLQDLGINCIWLSPIYPSPMHDFGYDVANYIDIHPMFGSLEDLDELIEELHQRGMKLMLDFVPNHTSSEHEWFQEALKGKNNPYRDYYIWRDPKEDGALPTNWTSHFGGPAWTFDDVSGQYYLHQFVPEQPELNYDNPKVIEGMTSFMKFWLDRGVDGFRLDVIFLIKKDQRFLDEPLNTEWDGVRPWEKTHRIYTTDVLGVHELIQQYRDLLDKYEDRVFLGEIYLPFNKLATYNNEIQLPSNTLLLTTPWEPHLLKKQIRRYFASLPDNAWPNWQLGNHDNHRAVSRIGRKQARVANMLLLTIKGTPITYYGEEIGMENGIIPLDKIQDPPAVNEPEHADEIGRDPERTPMQWDNTSSAGFTDSEVEPWLPVGSNLDEISVQRQEDDPTSMLNLYRQLVELRSNNPALSVGDYSEVDLGVEDIFAYLRYDESTTFLIILNLGEIHHHLDFSSSLNQHTGQIMLNTTLDRNDEVLLNDMAVGSNEGIILQLQV